ncbi:MAG: hypothetical protein WC656_01525 [Sulfurimonas sp.]|jgi:hypothetical protein
MDAIKEIQIGSKVYINSVQTVVRETKTMFITEFNVRFHKKDFCVVGGCKKVVLATQEHLDTKEKNDLIFKIKKVDLHSKSIEKIRELCKLLNA